jgi:hypothetical protein
LYRRVLEALKARDYNLYVTAIIGAFTLFYRALNVCGKVSVHMKL